MKLLMILEALLDENGYKIYNFETAPDFGYNILSGSSIWDGGSSTGQYWNQFIVVTHVQHCHISSSVKLKEIQIMNLADLYSLHFIDVTT